MDPSIYWAKSLRNQVKWCTGFLSRIFSVPLGGNYEEIVYTKYLKKENIPYCTKKSDNYFIIKAKNFLQSHLFFFFSLNKIQENISAFSWKMNLDWTFGQKGDFTYHKTMLSFIETSCLYFHNWKKKKKLTQPLS